MAILWDGRRLQVDMFKIYNVLGWIRKVEVPEWVTKDLAGFNYAGVSFNKLTSMGVLRFEQDSKIALLVFLERDLTKFGMNSFQIIAKHFKDLDPGVTIKDMKNIRSFQLLLSNGTLLQYRIQRKV